MFNQNIEQSIYDAQQSIDTLQTLKDSISAYQNVLTVEDVITLIDQHIRDAHHQRQSYLLTKKLDAHLPDAAKAALLHT